MKEGVIIYSDVDRFLEDLNRNLNPKRTIITRPQNMENDLCKLHTYDFYQKYINNVEKIIFEK